MIFHFYVSLKMNFKSFRLLILPWLILSSTAIHSQGVGINENGSSPDPSAILDASSVSKGFLPPRMTTLQRNAIANPAEGLQIFNTTTKCLEVYISPNWQNIFCGCSSAPSNLSFTQNGPLVYCLSQSISGNFATTQGSTPNSFTITPSLPAGLAMNSTNGQLSGTPTAVSSATDYVVSANNACGNTSRVLNLSVVNTPAAPLSITGPSAPTVGLTTTYSVSNVDYATSYQWTVPSGWSIVSGQGTPTVTIQPGNNAGIVGVTASNVCGTSGVTTKSITPWRPVSATGGTVSVYTSDGTNGVSGVMYKVHSFTNVGSSTFIVTDQGTDGLVDYLVVAGGGGGAGTAAGGGGGGGGYLSGTNLAVNSLTYPVVVGQGGSGGAGNWEVCAVNVQYTGSNGGVSSFNGIQASGGGGGGLFSNSGLSGGSGGGASGRNNASGGAGITLQGNNGGNSRTADISGSGAGGGGGGALSVGANGVNQSGGNGGSGKVSSITGSAIYRSGGGGGGVYDGFSFGGNSGIGGQGGGGNGGSPVNSSAGMGQDAVANSGGGGGGAGGKCAPGSSDQGYVGQRGGNGASGIVVIRYPVSNPNP